MFILIDKIQAANTTFGSQDPRVSFFVRAIELTRLFLIDAILKRNNMVLSPLLEMPPLLSTSCVMKS